MNPKVKLNLKWIKLCVLSAAGADNTKCNPNNIIFTIKQTKLFVPVVTLLTNINQKLTKLFSKRYKRLLYWNQYKAKSENKVTTRK